MPEQIFSWAFTVLYVGLLFWLMRRSGTVVSGSADPEPFQSREEYLEARESMNLSDFLDRAYVTPEEIKTKPAAIPSTEDAIKFMIKNFQGDLKGALNITQSVMTLDELKKIQQPSETDIQLAAQGYFTVPVEDLRAGLFARLKKDGKVYRILEVRLSSILYLEKHLGNLYVFMQDAPVALPVAGELWTSVRCALHSKEQQTEFEAIDYYPVSAPSRVLCGCLKFGFMV